MRYIATLLLLCAPAFGDVRNCTIFQEISPDLCVTHECSDDSLAIPIYGNEFVKFEPYSDEFDYDEDGTFDPIDRFQIAISTDASPIPELCGVVDDCEWSPYELQGCFPIEGQEVHYWIRVCTLKGCGEWNQVATVIGGSYACFEVCGEVPCYGGAGLRFPALACPNS